MINDILTSGLLLSVAYALRDIPVNLYKKVKSRIRLTYDVHVYQYDDLYWMFEEWLYAHHNKTYKSVEAVTEFGRNAHSDYPKDFNCQEIQIQYKQETNIFFIRYKGKRLLIDKTKEKLDPGKSSIKSAFFEFYHISGWRAKAQIESLLHDVVLYSKSKKRNGEVEILGSGTYHNDWNTINKIIVKPLDKIVLKDGVRSGLIKDLDEFERSKDWYISTGISYKRGYIFYGPPGTGKTSLALSIAAYLGRRVCMLNLRSFEDNNGMTKAFASIPAYSVLLIEDIDASFNGRSEIEGNRVSFSTLLNCLDGVLVKQGVITVITTNHIERLDDALLREGRCDVKIEIPNPGREEIQEYLRLFFNKEISIANVSECRGMATIQEICIRHKGNYQAAVREICR